MGNPLFHKLRNFSFLSQKLYYSYDFSIPPSYEFGRKDKIIIDINSGNTKQKFSIIKNELILEMFSSINKLHINFSHILFDSWSSSTENMFFIRSKMKRKFITCLKSNRYIALNKKDKLNGKWI